MTDADWHACTDPARMKHQVRGLAFRRVNWVRFDLACVARVRDLFDHAGYIQFLDRAGQWAEKPDTEWWGLYDHPGRGYVGDAVHSLWNRKPDPLRGARLAAARAVVMLGSGTLATSNMVGVATGRKDGTAGLAAAVAAERRVHADLLRCAFRSTLGPVRFDPAWRTETAVCLARHVHGSWDHGALPILADALQDAGCDSEAVLDHCRSGATHTKGCWVVSLVLGNS